MTNEKPKGVLRNAVTLKDVYEATGKLVDRLKALAEKINESEAKSLIDLMNAVSTSKQGILDVIKTPRWPKVGKSLMGTLIERILELEKAIKMCEKKYT